MSIVRRLYFYLVAFIAINVMAFSAGRLLAALAQLLLQPGQPLAGDIGWWRAQVIPWVAALIVSTPVWAIHWIAAQRATARDEDEKRSVFRRLFLYATMGVGAIVALINFGRVLYPALGLPLATLGPMAGSDTGRAAGWFIIYGALWYYHWRVDGQEAPLAPSGMTVRRWYLYILCGVALGILAYNLGRTVYSIAEEILSRLAAVALTTGPSQLALQLSRFVPPAVAALVWWLFHWRYLAWGDRQSVLRQVYLYLVVFASVIGTLAATSVFLVEGLRFALGYRAPSLAMQLEALPFALSMLLVAAPSWVYHWTVLREEAAPLLPRLAAIRRLYYYLLAAVGLGAVGIGVANLVRVLLEFWLQVGVELGRPLDWWRDEVSIFTVFTIVGLPVWLYHWQTMQRLALEREAEERQALFRRMFLYLVLFATVIVILFNAGFLINGLLRALLAEPISGRFLSGLFVNVGNVVVAGVLLAYHWQVLQGDMRVAARPLAVRKSVLALTSADYDESIQRLSESLGFRIRVLGRVAGELERAPQALTPGEIAAIASRIAEAPSDKVLVLFLPGGVEVYPYI